MSYLSSLNASTLLAQSSLTKGTERAAVSMERLSTGLAVAEVPRMILLLIMRGQP